MKLPLLSLSLALAGSLAGNAQAATTGVLRFEGLIQNGTCNLAAGDTNRTITLDSVLVTEFDSQISARQKAFELTAKCDGDVKNVTFKFLGTPNPASTYRFANTGTATGISLWLVSGDGKTIGADGTDNARTVSVVDGVAVMPLKASYYKVGTVGAGTLLSLVTVDLTYN